MIAAVLRKYDAVYLKCLLWFIILLNYMKYIILAKIIKIK